MYSAHRSCSNGSLVLAAILAVFSTAGVAADHIIDFDRQVDFSAMRTYTLRDTAIRIDRPEVNSPLVVQDITATLRAALTSQGLQESTGNADLIVDWTVSGQRFGINEWGNAIPLDNVPGERRIGPGNPWRGLPEAFVEGSLLIDITARSSGLLVWRGVYRNREKSSGKLAHELSGYAKKLFAGYPPRKK